MLENIKTLLGITDTSKDGVLNILIANVQAFIVAYCNLTIYSTSLDYIAVEMVLEDYNKIGAQGIASRSYSGVSESYNDDYSAAIYKKLNKHRKIKMV